MAQPDIEVLNERLRSAIGSLPPDLAPAAEGGLGDNYQAWAGEQMALQHWANALIRDLTRLDELLEQVRKPPRPPVMDDATLPLEEAFWRVDAASEKLFVLLTIALGVPAVQVEGRRVCFQPHRDPARRKTLRRLKRLAKNDDAVRQLMSIYSELTQAREYRNQVSHSLSAITNTLLAPFVGVYMDAKLRVTRTLHHYIPPLGVFVPVRTSTLGPCWLALRRSPRTPRSACLRRRGCVLESLLRTAGSGLARPSTSLRMSPAFAILVPQAPDRRRPSARPTAGVASCRATRTYWPLRDGDGSQRSHCSHQGQ